MYSCYFLPFLELIQKTCIILIEKTHVIDFILEQRDTLEAHTEGED